MSPPESAWRKYDELERRLTSAVSDRMLDLARLMPGMRVIDVACGRGEPALGAAKRVGPGGAVLGFDLSEVVLAIAQERAIAEKVSNASFRALNAESLVGLPDSSFDAATSRWGLMYIQSPSRALAELRRVLRPEAPLVIAVWAEPERVPWASLPRRAMGQFCEMPPPDADAPGACRYANMSRLERDLRGARFEIEHVEEMTTSVIEAPNPEGILRWVHDLGFARLASHLSEAQALAWQKDLLLQLEGHRAGDVVRLGGVTRLVVARSKP